MCRVCEWASEWSVWNSLMEVNTGGFCSAVLPTTSTREGQESLPRWTEWCHLFPVLTAGSHVCMLAHVSLVHVYGGGAGGRGRRWSQEVIDDTETGENVSVSLLNPASDRTHDKLDELTEAHSERAAAQTATQQHFSSFFSIPFFLLPEITEKL